MLHDVFTLGLSGWVTGVWRHTLTLHHELAQLLKSYLGQEWIRI
jgi:hypothetical protein